MISNYFVACLKRQEGDILATMAMFASKVVFVFTTMILMGLKVQGVPVSFGNVLSPLTTVTVRCLKDSQDVGTRTISPWKEYSVFIPTGFYGAYVCEFAASGKKSTKFDVINSRCNCNTFYGCAWVAKSDGFYCNFEIIHRWA